jgi:hypothetical protein
MFFFRQSYPNRANLFIARPLPLWPADHQGRFIALYLFPALSHFSGMIVASIFRCVMKKSLSAL